MDVNGIKANWDDRFAKYRKTLSIFKIMTSHFKHLTSNIVDQVWSKRHNEERIDRLDIFFKLLIGDHIISRHLRAAKFSI